MNLNSLAPMQVLNAVLVFFTIFAALAEREKIKNAWKNLFMLECVLDDQLNNLKVPTKFSMQISEQIFGHFWTFLTYEMMTKYIYNICF